MSVVTCQVLGVTWGRGGLPNSKLMKELFCLSLDTFKALAVVPSVVPSFCPCVCLFTFEVPVKCLFAPTF